MSSSRKQILIAGLGRHVRTIGLDIDEIGAKIEADTQRAADAGFDCTVVEVNPADREGSLAKTRAALQAQQFDAFSIGFALRGIKENTPLFEDLVQLTRDVAPKTKLVFATGPDKIYDAIRRGFPEEGKEGK